MKPAYFTYEKEDAAWILSALSDKGVYVAQFGVNFVSLKNVCVFEPNERVPRDCITFIQFNTKLHIADNSNAAFLHYCNQYTLEKKRVQEIANNRIPFRVR